MVKLKKFVVPSIALVYLVFVPLGEAICHSSGCSIQQEFVYGEDGRMPCHSMNKQLDTNDIFPSSDSRIAGIEMVNCVSGVINVYSPVLSICDGGNITVEHPHLFSPGDKVLIHQAKGATCNSTNTPLCGDLLDLGGAGLYEFNIIRSIQGTNITFEFFLLNDYDLAGRVQMVSVPILGDTSVCNLTCAPWNGSTGGILVFEGGRIEVSGDIDVSGKGFRGGILTPWPSNMLETILDYIGQNSNDGGMKGEGIAFLPASLRWGKGKWTNGGGGGNNHNAGGGGGAGAGSGGFGGTYLGFPLETRGIGGQGVFSFGRLYFGGGGGAGHDNNNYGQSGSPGGGIVLIQVDEFVSQGPFAIKADGASGAVAGIDGAGGGGGGGSIWIRADSVSSILTFSASGGRGGDNNSFPDDYQCVGTGGGGGGGSIFSEIPLASVSVEGGLSGLVVNNATYFACVPKPQSGYADDGNPGEVTWQVSENSASIPYFNFSFESFDLVGSCDSLLFRIGLGVHSPDLVFTLGDQEFLNGDTMVLDSAGVYSLKVANQCLVWDSLIIIDQPDPLMLHLDSLSHIHCPNGIGSIVVSGSGGVAPYTFSLNGGLYQQNGIFLIDTAGIYTISIMDTRGCILEENHMIIDYGEIVELEIFENDLEWSCMDTSVQITLNATSSAESFWFWLNDSIFVQDSVLNGLMPGIYSIQAEDENGCKSDLKFFEIIDVSITDTFHFSFESFELLESCDSLLLRIGLGVHSPDLVFKFGDQEFLNGDTLILDSAGVYTLEVANQCLEWDSLITIDQPDPLMLHLDSLSHLFCQSGTGSFVVSGSGGIGPYMYTLNGGPQQQNGVFIVNAGGNYTINITDSRGCMLEESHVIVDYGEIIELEVEGLDLEWSCLDTTVEVALYATSTAESFWFWLNDSIFVQDSVLNGLMPGIYSIQAENEHGCKSELMFFEIIDVSVLDTFYLSVSKCDGEGIAIGDSVYYEPGNYINHIDNEYGCDSLIITTLTYLDTNNVHFDFAICEGEIVVLGGNEYSQPGNYSIVLDNIHGCDSTLNITIWIKDRQICDSMYCRAYVPNAFSPNGDGINDIFHAYSSTIEFHELDIFDRWGGLLYVEKSSSPSWNGMVGKNLVDPGVFVYILKGICSNNQKIILKGDVTITY